MSCATVGSGVRFLPQAAFFFLQLLSGFWGQCTVTELGFFSAKVKQPKHTFHHLPVSDAEMKNMWSYPTCSEVYEV